MQPWLVARVRSAVLGAIAVAAVGSIASAEVPRNRHAWAPAADPKPQKKAAAKPKRRACPKKAANEAANDSAIVMTPAKTKDARLVISGGMLIVPPAGDAAIVLVPDPAPSPRTHGPCRGS